MSLDLGRHTPNSRIRSLTVMYRSPAPPAPQWQEWMFVESTSDADVMAKAVLRQFIRVSTRLKPEFRNFKVISGFVVVRDGDLSTSRVLSWASGTKCINGGRISNSGTAVIDCHAEIVARRGLMRVLYGEVAKIVSGAGESDLLEEGIGEDRFKLKRGLTLHLYISTAPCGAGRCGIFESAGDERDRRLRTKAEATAGTVVVDELEGGVLTTDGVLGGHQRLMNMSCTDKLTKWRALGLQGTLLSQWLEPIPLRSLIVGSFFHRTWLNQCINERIEGFVDGLVDASSKTAPLKMEWTQHHPQRDPSADTPDYSVNWNFFDDDIEILDARVGRLFHTDGPSRLSKKSFFTAFIALSELRASSGERSTLSIGSSDPQTSTSSTGTESPLACYHYHRLKKSLPHHSMITGFHRWLREKGFGAWIAKPSDMGWFRLMARDRIHHEKFLKAGDFKNVFESQADADPLRVRAEYEQKHVANPDAPGGYNGATVDPLDYYYSTYSTAKGPRSFSADLYESLIDRSSFDKVRREVSTASLGDRMFDDWGGGYCFDGRFGRADGICSVVPDLEGEVVSMSMPDGALIATTNGTSVPQPDLGIISLTSSTNNVLTSISETTSHSGLDAVDTSTPDPGLDAVDTSTLDPAVLSLQKAAASPFPSKLDAASTATPDVLIFATDGELTSDAAPSQEPLLMSFDDSTPGGIVSDEDNPDPWDVMERRSKTIPADFAMKLTDVVSSCSFTNEGFTEADGDVAEPARPDCVAEALVENDDAPPLLTEGRTESVSERMAKCSPSWSSSSFRSEVLPSSSVASSLAGCEGDPPPLDPRLEPASVGLLDDEIEDIEDAIATSSIGNSKQPLSSDRSFDVDDSRSDSAAECGPPTGRDAFEVTSVNATSRVAVDAKSIVTTGEEPSFSHREDVHSRKADPMDDFSRTCEEFLSIDPMRGCGNGRRLANAFGANSEETYGQYEEATTAPSLKTRKDGAVFGPRSRPKARAFANTNLFLSDLGGGYSFNDF